MSRSTTCRQLARTLLRSQPQSQSQSQPWANIRSASHFSRPFSSSPARPADDPSDERQSDDNSNLLSSLLSTPPADSPDSNSTGLTAPKRSRLGDLLEPRAGGGGSPSLANRVLGNARNVPVAFNADILSQPLDKILEAEAKEDDHEPFHFHINATRRNTHVTVTRPNRNAIVSLSCGNLGFKKAQRKQYDSAYQLGAYVIDKLQQQPGLEINHLEVVLRGFGPGREAVTKVLMGNEGRLLRPKIIKVSDSTRVKFGGTRSPKPRRLG